MMCSNSVPICNRFHTIRTNRGKMTYFRGYPSLTPSFGDEILSQKTRVLMAAHNENVVILACTVLIGLKGVTHTDRLTDT